MPTRLFTENLDVVFFVYGLSFVVMGIAILIQPRRETIFKLKDVIWLLAAFGFIHGLNEWLDMWAIIRRTNSNVFSSIRLACLSVSFFLLFEFGRRFILLSRKKFFSAWVTVLLCFSVLALDYMSKYDHSIWPRYLLGFPGGALSAAGFILYYRAHGNVLKSMNVRRYFILAAISMLIYGIAGGVVVPKAGFFPASVINNSSFLDLFGIPVQVVRAVCSSVLAWSVWNILGIFDWESKEKLKNSLEMSQWAFEELKKIQKMFIQAEKLNAAGQLAAGIAHEVKNPLSIIMQGVDYMESKIPPEQKDVCETLIMIKDSAGRADNIIRSLLDFSRVSALSLEPQSISSILDSTLELVKQKTRTEHVEVIKELEKGIPDVLADKNSMEQVFINILLNAMQAMPEGGKIFIRGYGKCLDEIINDAGERPDASFSVGEKVVVVEIEDTGMGIPEENIKKIFDPFFTTKDPGKGTGLGLSVSRSILTAHKGSIYVQSRVGKGAIVTVTLKAA